MTIQNPKELFVMLLSDVRQREERMTNIFQELSQIAKDPDIKEALESRVFLENQILSSVDQCFKLIGEQPMQVTNRLQEVFMEDFRKELNEIKAPIARHLFVIAKAAHLMHLRQAEYMVLIAMADLTGHYGVGTLLENCLADKLAFIERTRRLIRHLVESEMAVGVA